MDIFINFNGKCRDAVEFYAEVFGLEKPKMMTFGRRDTIPFNKLKVGDKVVMELQETFWSNYGSVVDKFGIPWQLARAMETILRQTIPNRRR